MTTEWPEKVSRFFANRAEMRHAQKDMPHWETAEDSADPESALGPANKEAHSSGLVGITRETLCTRGIPSPPLLTVSVK